jgi:hypothetical protein
MHQQQQQQGVGAAGEAALLLEGGQQVTHMLLLGSDSPSQHHLAVILASGPILFYDLATYCIPGAAVHPDCCIVGSGHIGRVTTTLEVTFKCPPQHLLRPEGSTAWHSTHGSLPRPVNWHFSSARAEHGTARGSGGEGSGACGSGDGGSGSGGPAQGVYEIECGGLQCVAEQQGWCERATQGGSLPLLLTGGRDGSLVAWDLRLSHLGHTWMAVHPHAGREVGVGVWGGVFGTPVINLSILNTPQSSLC